MTVQHTGSPGSPGGRSTPASVRHTGSPLPFDDPRHLKAHQFLVDEAYLLDAQQYEEWLDTLTDDIRYLMPVAVTTELGAAPLSTPGMAHYDETKYSLQRRVARFRTQHAWTEDPPSRLRHFITNVRTFATDTADELAVESAELLFRSRGDVQEPALLACGRQDLLRHNDNHWQLARRTINVDESVIRMQNLAVFL